MTAVAIIQMLAQLLLLMVLLLLLQLLLLVATAKARAARATIAAIAGHAVGILIGYGYARAILDVHNGTLHCKRSNK